MDSAGLWEKLGTSLGTVEAKTKIPTNEVEVVVLRLTTGRRWIVFAAWGGRMLNHTSCASELQAGEFYSNYQQIWSMPAPDTVKQEAQDSPEICIHLASLLNRELITGAMQGFEQATAQATEHFARAFFDETKLKPTEAVMCSQWFGNEYRVWFRRRSEAEQELSEVAKPPTMRPMVADEPEALPRAPEEHVGLGEPEPND